MLGERVAPQSEVIRVIVLEDSPCCEVPHRLSGRTLFDVGAVEVRGRVRVEALKCEPEVIRAI